LFRYPVIGCRRNDLSIRMIPAACCGVILSPLPSREEIRISSCASVSFNNGASVMYSVPAALAFQNVCVRRSLILFTS